MNQPKFKFGDLVRHQIQEGKIKIFTVRAIRFSTSLQRYMYGESESADLSEGNIELYQEPQKKKLCAYTYEYSTDGKSKEIKFLMHDEPMWGHWKRTPEYDISYN